MSLTGSVGIKPLVALQKSQQPLGNGLEARIRGNQGRISGLPGHRSLVVGCSDASPITTDLRTIGMPAGSPTNFVAYLTSADTLQISSSNALDTLTGTGARQVTIIGLDTNCEEISELVSLLGTTPVSTTASFFRINKILVEEVGSTGMNQGDIYISDSTETYVNIAGVPDTKVLYAMLASVLFQPQNISFFGSYTVPANKRLWLVKGNYYTDAIQSKTLLLREDYYDVSNLGNRIQYGGGSLKFSGSVSFNFDGAAHFNPKTDYNWSAKSSQSTLVGTIYYEAVLEDISILTI